MSTIDEQTACDLMMELFILYLCNIIEKKVLTKLDNKLKESKTFLEYMCEEQGFKSEEDALQCGRFIKNYFKKHNKVPDNLPYKNIWQKVLKLGFLYH